MPHFPTILGLLSLLNISFFFFSTRRVFENLSPQGCRMSWMSPSYVLQDGFDTSWSPLADRYSLLLYREVGWDPSEIQGAPVLFIPGNAGSSHQVRSIASSATRQFYSSPSVPAPEFLSRKLKPLDFFAVEFNEDLSAFHGPTLDSQIAYTSRAMSYILSLYPSNTPIIIMGHSMGGIVATSLLPNRNVSAIITMSTPHVLPPGRFDPRIDKIYGNIKRVLDTDSTPILSLCGGAADMMIPSESCVLPIKGTKDAFRRTIFTSALDGAWTGVGHREMVWCHQVRWRVARAALEMTITTSPSERVHTLDTWLRDGQELPSGDFVPKTSGSGVVDPSKYEVIADDERLIVARPQGASMHLAPVPPAESSSLSSALKAVVFVGLGSIVPNPSHSSYPMQVAVLLCTKSADKGGSCSPLKPSLLRVIPNPATGNAFPLPEQGAEESDGVSVLEAEIPSVEPEAQAQRWLGVRIEGGEGRGWVYGGFSMDDEVSVAASTFSFLFGSVDVTFPNKRSLRTRFVFPNAISSSLVVYKYKPIRPEEPPWCSDPLLAPVIMHTPQPMETHYYPINALNRHILLHMHTSGPYIPSLDSTRRTLDFVVYSSGSIGCSMLGFSLGVDWPATLGRWASRYPTTLITWSIGIVAIVLFMAWGIADHSGIMPAVGQSLLIYSRRVLGKLLLASVLIALLPIPADYYLGTGGGIFYAPIAPLLLLTASGLVCVSWGLLACLVWLLAAFEAFIPGSRKRRRQENIGIRKSTIISMVIILALIFFFVPWQVAYLGCWIIHLYSCASSERHISLLRAASDPASCTMASNGVQVDKPEQAGARNQETQQSSRARDKLDGHNHRMHLLLLMTWLLPLVAPVLVVWARTLATAGLTAPFDSDHDFANVAPFLVLVDFTSRDTDKLLKRQKFEKIYSTKWCWAVLAAVAVFIGPRKTYSVFDAAKIVVGLIVVIRIGRRYWGGASWG